MIHIRLRRSLTIASATQFEVIVCIGIETAQVTARDKGCDQPLLFAAKHQLRRTQREISPGSAEKPSQGMLAQICSWRESLRDDKGLDGGVA